MSQDASDWPPASALASAAAVPAASALTPPCGSAVDAEDRLGDADRLVAALALDDDGDGDLQAAGDLLDVLERRACSRTFEPTGTGAGKRTLFRP